MNLNKDLTVGSVCKSIRTARNLNQKDLAELLGKPQSFISKIEQGKRSLTVHEIIDFARAFHMKPEKLFSLIEIALSCSSGWANQQSLHNQFDYYIVIIECENKCTQSKCPKND